MESPVVVTLTTLSSVSCCLNTSYDSVTVVGWAGAKRTLVMKMLASRTSARVTQRRVERMGFGGTGCADWGPRGAGGAGCDARAGRGGLVGGPFSPIWYLEVRSPRAVATEGQENGDRGRSWSLPSTNRSTFSL